MLLLLNESAKCYKLKKLTWMRVYKYYNYLCIHTVETEEQMTKQIKVKR